MQNNIIRSTPLGKLEFGTKDMQTTSDEELVANYIKSHDHQYLTELFKRHSDILYRNAFRKMKNPADAEDIMQIAYIKMLKDLPSYKGTGSVLGWMLLVVMHSCFDRLRSEKSRRNRDKKIMSERAQMVDPKNYELSEMIENHLNKLPEIYKVPITLKIIDGLTIKEVSEVLAIPEKTIRSQIERGLEKLKLSLQNVGVTASIISIGDMVKEIQQPITPELFKSNQYFNNLFQSKAAASTKLKIVVSPKDYMIKNTIGFLAFVTILTGTFFSWNHFSNNDEIVKPREPSVTADINAVKPLEDKQNLLLSKTWVFEDYKEFLDFKLIRGDIVGVGESGENNSNCMGVNLDTVIEIDISKFKLPLKISFVFDCTIPKGKTSNGIVCVKGNLPSDKNIFSFVSLHPTPNVDVTKIINRNNNSKSGFLGKWMSQKIYVSSNGIDSWLNGNRTGVVLCTSKDNAKIYINFKDRTILDNLKIESIEENEAPDISPYVAYAASIPFIKGAKDYYSLEVQMAPLNLDKNSQAKLGICDSQTMIKVLGINQKMNIQAKFLITPTEQIKSNKEFFTDPK
jgi:RNA polymerase sigma factor (sigma-70 family)